MANAVDAPGLSFPRDTFAALTPRPFILGHLQHDARPNARPHNGFRRPTINTGSLTHSNGSAVVRLGDTAVVCGVRAEILLASDIPRPTNEDIEENHLVEEIGLLVPNLELSTGCSPAHLPGSPPSSLAQSLSYRINALLHDSQTVGASQLRIQYTEPKTDDDLPDEQPRVVTKAYWTLYIDILCLALDGNAFDAAWLAVMAALRNTTLPKAWWDADRECILCSPLASDASSLQLAGRPFACTFAVFTTASPLKRREDACSWILADPDSSEEGVCDETLTVVLASNKAGGYSILRVEKGGGSFVGKDVLRRCIHEAQNRWQELDAILGNG